MQTREEEEDKEGRERGGRSGARERLKEQR
jgi:hypothetical protein